jgi:pimeloyl-ACP methyl ester carboxylesterase
MNTWKSDYIVANKLKLHYTRTGGDKQPFLLAHGITDDGLCWTTVAEALAAEYDVIMLDARGHGRSDAPKHGYGPKMHAKDLAGVISKLKLKRPIILGHSMGAITTLAFASLHPNTPGAILLEDPPPWWMLQGEVSKEEETQQIPRQEWMTALKRKTHLDLVNGQQAAMPHWSKAEIERWAESKQRFSLNVIEAFDAKISRTVDWKTILPRIKCPVLLITADPSYGSLVTNEGAKALQLLIPQLQIANISEAGHSVRHDQFEKYMKAVQTFLAEINP